MHLSAVLSEMYFLQMLYIILCYLLLIFHVNGVRAFALGFEHDTEWQQ